jgi:replicative DNA helicase
MLKEQNLLDVIIIDYLGLITHEINGRRIEPKIAEVTEISRQLKSLARELEVQLLLFLNLIDQLNKEKIKDQ